MAEVSSMERDFCCNVYMQMSLLLLSALLPHAGAMVFRLQAVHHPNQQHLLGDSVSCSLSIHEPLICEHVQ